MPHGSPVHHLRIFHFVDWRERLMANEPVVITRPAHAPSALFLSSSGCVRQCLGGTTKSTPNFNSGGVGDRQDAFPVPGEIAGGISVEGEESWLFDDASLIASSPPGRALNQTKSAGVAPTTCAFPRWGKSTRAWCRKSARRLLQSPGFVAGGHGGTMSASLGGDRCAGLGSWAPPRGGDGAARSVRALAAVAP